MNLTENELILTAKAFSIAAHSAVGQKRQYTLEEYYTHPKIVVDILVLYAENVTPEMVAATYLHDVVEDTECTLTHLSEIFPDRVLFMVDLLESYSKKINSKENRETRKAMDRKFLARANPEVKTIKLADIIHNLSSFRDALKLPEGQRPKKSFVDMYFEEKRLMVAILEEGGDPTLAKRAKEIIEEYQND